MKGIKKYTKSYDVTKQLAKEKLGKAANSVDNDQTKYTREKLHLIKWILKHTKVAGQDYIHYQDTLSEKETALGNVLAAMGDSGTIDAAVGDSYGAVGNAMRDSASEMKNVSRYTTENILTPLAQLYDDDAKQVLECKQKQEVARLQYESAQEKVKENQKKGGKKLSEAEQELQQKKTNYDSITQDLDTQCTLLIRKMDERLLPLLQSYAQSQAEHYAKLADQWRKTHECVTQLASMPHQPMHHASLSQHDAAAQSIRHHTPAQPTQQHTHQPAVETHKDGNPFEAPNPAPPNLSQFPPQPSMQNFGHVTQPTNSGTPTSSSTYQAPNYYPPQPSMQNFSQFTPPAKSGNATSSVATSPNYYPQEHDPFQQTVGSPPDPFMQPAQQSRNVYSK